MPDIIFLSPFEISGDPVLTNGLLTRYTDFSNENRKFIAVTKTVAKNGISVTPIKPMSKRHFVTLVDVFLKDVYENMLTNFAFQRN